jgi:hypothetical protein
MPIRSVFAMVLLLGTSAVVAAQQILTDPAYSAYNAVFADMQFPKRDPLILIIATTQSTQCGDQGTGMVLINGCGMWAPPQTAAAVHDVLRKDWPRMYDSTWTNFLQVNKTQLPLQNRVNPPWRHEFRNFTNEPAATEKPDGVVLLSAVGFNSDRSQAIVYVLFLSYMEGATTSGNLFLLKKTPSGLWQIDGRETLIEMASGN